MLCLNFCTKQKPSTGNFVNGFNLQFGNSEVNCQIDINETLYREVPTSTNGAPKRFTLLCKKAYRLLNIFEKYSQQQFPMYHCHREHVLGIAELFFREYIPVTSHGALDTADYTSSSQLPFKTQIYAIFPNVQTPGSA